MNIQNAASSPVSANQAEAVRFLSVLAALRSLAGTEYDRTLGGAVTADLDRIARPEVRRTWLTDNFVRKHDTVANFPTVDPQLADELHFVEWRGTEDGLPRAALFEPVRSGFFVGAIGVRFFVAPSDGVFAVPGLVIVDLQGSAGRELGRVDQLRIEAGLQPARHADIGELRRMDAGSVFLRDEFFVRAEPSAEHPAVCIHEEIRPGAWRSWGSDGLKFALTTTAVQRRAGEPLLAPSLPQAVRDAAVLLGANTLLGGAFEALCILRMLSVRRRLH